MEPCNTCGFIAKDSMELHYHICRNVIEIKKLHTRVAELEAERDEAQRHGQQGWTQYHESQSDLRAEEQQHEAAKAERDAQQSSDMECTLDQMLSIDQCAEWGFDEQEHRRNVQLMFVRACSAITELEAERDALKCCGNCTYGETLFMPQSFDCLNPSVDKREVEPSYVCPHWTRKDGEK